MIDWTWLSQSEQWIYEFKADQSEVLVDYEGPYLAIYSTKDNGLYFGIFCDFVEDDFRWMLAPITNAERIAIISGMTSLRDVFNKRIILICDFDNNYLAKKAWHCSPESIPSSILPKPHQPLPSFARKPIHELLEINATDSIIKLDGQAIKNNSLPFKELGHFLVFFQDYWDKLSKSTFLASSKNAESTDYKALASLSFCTAREGSINIYFKSTFENDEASSIISKTISTMKSITDDEVPEKIISDLGKPGLKDARRMHSMLHSAGIDMLLVSTDTTWFIGSEKSGEIARALNKTAREQENNKIMRGYFCAGRNKKATHTFEFIDEISGKSFKGKISHLIWKYKAISVGPSEYYEVEIEAYEKNKGRHIVEIIYTLIRADKVARPTLV